MLSSISFDVCSLDNIYNSTDGFEYSLPRAVLEEYLSGKAFDNKEVYSEEDSRNLRDDIQEIYLGSLRAIGIEDGQGVKPTRLALGNVEAVAARRRTEDRQIGQAELAEGLVR